PGRRPGAGSVKPMMPEGGERVASKDQMFSKGPMMPGGPPMETAKDLGGTARRLLRRMHIAPVAGAAILLLTITSVSLSSLGPKILGKGTDIIVKGVMSRQGIDFADLRNVMLGAIGLFLVASFLAWIQGYILA